MPSQPIQLPIRDYADAIMIQDACNPIAIVNWLAGIVSKLRESGADHRQIVEHPIIILGVNKLESMVHSEQCFSSAYNACSTIAESTTA